MEITENRTGNATTLSIVGRVDSSASPLLEQKARELVARDDRIVIDLRAMSYVSSAGLRSFIVLAKHARARNRTVALCGMQEDVVEVFELTGLLGLFAVYDTMEAAVAAQP